MKKDIKMLGWFWGTLHTMLKANLKLTIAEALGQGRFWECKMEGSHQPFQPQIALGHHFSQAHAAHTREGWRDEANRLYQTWKTLAQEEDEEGIQIEDHTRRSSRRRKLE
jgi:hypothetical protein